MARPRAQVDPKLVEALARIGCTYDEIASVTGVSKRTLLRRFVTVVKKGHDEARVSIRRQQFAMLAKGNVTMAIWLGKQMLGQSDRAVTAHAGIEDFTTADVIRTMSEYAAPGPPHDDKG